MNCHDGTAGRHIRAKAFPYPTQFPQEAVETGSALESALVRLRRIQAVSEVVSGAKCCFVVSAQHVEISEPMNEGDGKRSEMREIYQRMHDHLPFGRAPTYMYF